MATKKLDGTGLSQVWAKIVANFQGKETGKGLSSNDYTTAEKQKLQGIAEGANKTTVDAALSSTSTNPVQNKIAKAELDKKLDSAEKGVANGVAGLDATGKVPTEQLPAGLPANGGNAETVNGHTVESNVPANAKFTDTVYNHPTTPGNKHIPSGGATGQILRWSADGTAVWGEDKDTTYSNMGAASASAAGKAGLVPAPAAGDQAKFLQANGTWATPTDTKYSNATASASGLMSAADKTKLDGMENTIDTKISAAVAGVYKFKGSVAFASLPTTGMVAGDTYNITNAFTTTASFAEGAGKSYPAGTNVSYTTDGKWDCLAGIYDFSEYLKASELVDITEEEIDAICVMPTV